MTPVPAQQVLDQYFLEARSRILDAAAILDRIGRGDGTVTGDARIARLHRAIEALSTAESGRAERIQRIFSLDYDPDWERPRPQA